MSLETLPCKKCGNIIIQTRDIDKPNNQREYQTYCTNCFNAGEQKPTPQQAITSWNRKKDEIICNG